MKNLTFFIALSGLFILTAFSLVPADQKVVILDIGHGGKDPGAHFEDALEKEINLKIAKCIIEENSNEKIKLITSRNGDEFKSIEDRINFADDNNADLLISIHSSFKNDENAKGVEIFYGFKEDAKELASHFKTHLSKDHEVSSVKAARFSVINDVKCPSIMIESGYLSNEEDLKRLTSKEGQKKIAEAILNAITEL